MRLDIYKAVTDRIIELLDQGTVPWRFPITGGGASQMPANLESRRNYRGINVFLLAVTAWVEGYDSPYWLTYRQAAKQGGHVRKGEKGSLVVFWKQHATKDKETGEKITIPVLRHFKVFNADQCDGVRSTDLDEARAKRATFAPIAEAERIVASYPNPPTIEHRGSQAFYRPATDTVRIAEPERFTSRESYYATLFHELSHSTGHSSRLDRGLDRETPMLGSPDYSKEELVAEMGAAFLAASAGISPQTIDQAAAYIAGWRKKLSGDKKLVVHAAGAGQRAAEWILGTKPEA